MKRIYQLIFLLLIGLPTLAQIRTQPAPAAPSLKVQGLNIDYFSPKEYVIGGTTLTGTQYLDKEVIITLSKLTKGEHVILQEKQLQMQLKTYGPKAYLMMYNYL